MTHKVAIIRVDERSQGFDDYSLVIDSITEWAEISHQDFEILKKAERGNWTFKVLEQIPDTSAFVAMTVGDYLEREKKELAIAEAKKKAAKKRLKKDA